MDPQQFVLHAAVFMVIVTVMMTASQWDKSPAPIQATHYTCKFDGGCTGPACDAAAMSAITLLPKDVDGRAYYARSDAPAQQIVLHPLSENEFFAPPTADASGGTLLTLRRTGTLILTEYEGLVVDGKILRQLSGSCHQIDAPRGQN